MKQEASKFLRKQRDSIKARDTKRSRSIQLPNCPKGKHDPTDGEPRANADAIDEEDDETLYNYLCETFDDDPSKSVFDEDFTRSTMEEQSIPSSGEPISDLASLKELGRTMKRKSGLSLEPMTYDTSDYVEHGHKRRKLEKKSPGPSMEELDDYEIEMAKAMEEELSQDLHEQEQRTGEILSEPCHTNEISKQTKRKRESMSSLEPSTDDSSDHVDGDSKRTKLEMGTQSVQVSSSGPPKMTRREGPSKLELDHLFCRSSSLAAVCEAAATVGAFKSSQADSSADSSGLSALDLELLGDESNDSEQKKTQSSIKEDLKLILGEVLYPLVSHEDLRVAKAAAKLLEIRQSSSNASELDPADQEALIRAFGASGEGTESGLWREAATA